MYQNGADHKSAAYAPAEWTTGLFDCFDDCSNCMLTYCCPCITFGRNAEIIDRGTTSCGLTGLLYFGLLYCGCACCVPCYTCSYRSKIRGLYSLPENPCNDFWVHCCCHGCALCQESRELKNRGFDPSIGWIANAERMNKGGTTAAPSFAPGMTR